MHTRTLRTLALAAICLLCAPATAETAYPDGSHVSAFAPDPAGTARLNFDGWDATLGEIVLRGGPSLRRRLPEPQQTATRIPLGHTTPFRQEGNRIPFELLERDHRRTLTAIRDEFAATADRVDVTLLPRDEQLAFWLNLHNVLVVEAIASDYPVRRPSRVKADDGTAFHSTERVTIRGESLSLRDIRELVMTHWPEPLVLYGFFRGDIGGPSLHHRAFTGANVRRELRNNAAEYANSLRGFNTTWGEPRVSEVYLEAAPHLFPGDASLRAHLRDVLHKDLADELDATPGPLRPVRYDTVVADLTAGRDIRQSPAKVLGESGGGRSNIDSFLIERKEKIRELRRRGGSQVTIEDVAAENLSGAAPTPPR